MSVHLPLVQGLEIGHLSGLQATYIRLLDRTEGWLLFARSCVTITPSLDHVLSVRMPMGTVVLHVINDHQYAAATRAHGCGYISSTKAQSECSGEF